MVLLPLILSAAAALSSPGAQKELTLIRKVYAGAPSVKVTFVQQYAPAGFPDLSPETGRLILQAPAFLRFEYDGSEGKLFTFDGKSARQYVAADKQMVVKTLSPTERARLPLLFLEEPRDLLARYDATVAPSENGLVELTLVPKAGSEPKKVTLLTSGEGEVKKLVILDGAGNRTTFTFTGKETGKKRPVSDFEVVPPRGTKIITGELNGGKEP